MYPVQIVMGQKMLSKENFNEIRNVDIKPFGGIWSSTYLPDNGRHISEWVRVAENFGVDWLSNDFAILKINNARVFEVTSLDSYFELVGKYHWEIGSDTPLLLSLPDFEAMSRDWDVIWFREQAVYEAKNPFFRMSLNEEKTSISFEERMNKLSLMTTMMAVDAESSLIMNFDIIDSQEYLFHKLV